MSDVALAQIKEKTGNITVLIVDDSPIIRAIIKKILESLGFKQLIECNNGFEAVKVLKKGTKVDLILSDWKMPSMSGTELLEEVRTNEEWKTIPFIMITAIADREILKESIKLNVTDFLLKPVEAKKLAQKVFKALNISI